MCQYPPVDSTIPASLNHSWPVIHLVVFLISGRGYFTFLYRYAKHNREGGRKEQTNKHGLGSAPSKRRGEVYVTLFVHSVFLWVNTSVYSSENSHKATSNADLNSLVGPPGICGSIGPSNFCWLASALTDSHLLGPPADSLFLSDLPSLVLPDSREISCSVPLCRFRAKTDKEVLWLAPPHRETDATHSVTIRNGEQSQKKKEEYFFIL